LCSRVLEQALGQFCDGKKVASLKSQGISAEAVLTVAGRTDKGVHAAGQVCSFCKFILSFLFISMMEPAHATMLIKWDVNHHCADSFVSRRISFSYQ
jgi:tRNA U38,U39,U40 pseudouridine synthase TruA